MRLRDKSFSHTVSPIINLTNIAAIDIHKKIMKNNKGDVSVIKKYEMQKFATQKGADTVIHDFGKIVFEQTERNLQSTL